MHNYLQRLDKEHYRILTAIGQEADKLPVNVFVVGGPVRDILLKRKVLDLDVVVEGDAILLAKKYAGEHAGSVVVHDRFGTATVHLKGDRHIDFVTARKEDYPYPGSLPVVKAGFISDDLFRRDFTVNAMAIRINGDRFGQLVDDFGGLKDLKDKKIRVLHQESFQDDPTRILRAVRFEQRLSFQLEAETAVWLKDAFKKNYPSRVKAERYFAEFRKILQEEKPVRSLKRLDRLGGLKFLGLRSKIDGRLMEILEYNIGLFQKRYKAGEPVQRDVLYLMGLVSSWDIKKLKLLGERFNLKCSERTALESLVDVKRAFRSLSKAGLKASTVFDILRPLSYETVVYLRNFHKHKLIQRYVDAFLLKYSHVRLALNGRDLNGLGLASGVKMKEVLGRILKEKIDGRIKTVQDERKFAQDLIKNIR